MVKDIINNISYNSTLQSDSLFVNFKTDNKELLYTIANDIINSEKLYGVSVSINDLLFFQVALYHLVIREKSYQTMGLLDSDFPLFTESEELEIIKRLQLKLYV